MKVEARSRHLLHILEVSKKARHECFITEEEKKAGVDPNLPFDFFWGQMTWLFDSICCFSFQTVSAPFATKGHACFGRNF